MSDGNWTAPNTTLGTQVYVAKATQGKCSYDDHNYQQGMDSPVHGAGQFSGLLFCSKCGDVVRLELR